jgi:hypothetical protein
VLVELAWDSGRVQSLRNFPSRSCPSPVCRRHRIHESRCTVTGKWIAWFSSQQRKRLSASSLLESGCSMAIVWRKMWKCKITLYWKRKGIKGGKNWQHKEGWWICAPHNHLLFKLLILDDIPLYSFSLEDNRSTVMGSQVFWDLSFLYDKCSLLPFAFSCFQFSTTLQLSASKATGTSHFNIWNHIRFCQH